MNSRIFTFSVRVYYEDTDAAGVVYYANYLKFLERCRSEWLRSAGFEQSALLREPGIAFVVRGVALEYLKPARLDDTLTVSLEVERITRVQVFFRQHVLRGNETLASAAVQLVCVKAENGRITSIPDTLRSQLEALQ